MKKFTEAEIEGTLDYFRQQGFEEVGVSLGNRRFSYFVLPQSLEPELPDFVYRCTGTSGKYVFGISDSVREDFRPYPIVHEFIEFTEIGINVKNRCVRALEKELELVPGDIMPEYVSMRRNFFRNLISYCAERPEHYTVDDIDEFRQTLERLEKINGTK
jgi:hypothetical protein